MDDDLFDIIGLSLFASGGDWCLLNSDPCVPLPSCDEHKAEGKCVYESAGEEDETLVSQSGLF
jgi:hypothetical protein